MRKFLIGLAAAAAVSSVATTAQAAVITLTFDELDGSGYESPLDYYAGGYGSLGTGPGVDYGITFSSNSIVGCEVTAACASTNVDQPPSSPNVLFFLSGGASTMNVAAGFDTGFSFYYSAVVYPGVVNVWSGLNSTGSLLATLTLPVTATGPGCAASYCPFTPIGVAFAGTAMSVDFGGTDNYIAFDNITLGAEVPTPGVPEPATWALLLGGFAITGAAMRRRKVSVAFA